MDNLKKIINLIYNQENANSDYSWVVFYNC